MTGPVLKSAGGKTRLLEQLRPQIGHVSGRYFEPFAGGAAVFFAMHPTRAVLADANADLIATYRAIAADVEAVIAEFEGYRTGHGRGRYYETRAAWNARSGSPVERAAQHLYLNHACFNGLWRVNASGELNVPVGSYARPALPSEAELRAASQALQRAELRVGSYAETLADAGPGDVVYADPPYDGTFTGYTAGGFGAAAQAELAFTARLLARRGARVVVSNADTPRVRALYAGCEVVRVTARRSIAARGGARKRANEVLVVLDGEVVAAMRSTTEQQQAGGTT